MVPLDKEAFKNQIGDCGYAIVPAVLPPDLLAELKHETLAAIQKEADYHGRTDYADYGLVLLNALYGGSFLKVFEVDALIEPFEWVLGEGCIVYAYGSSSMPPQSGNVSCRIHVDCPRLIPGYITNLGGMMLLNDLTEENGATWFLPGSHVMPEPPDKEHFYSHGKRVIAPAGSVFYFNTRLWHAGAPNHTDCWRHTLAINMCRPYMKQRLDIPRAMAHMDLSGVPRRTLQKLGFLSQVPASYDEYYAPKELRKFQQTPE
jgi:ectoine hydroxylase-related dioxygenase (phytanoyl-CoA dioxygenase family)